MATGNNITIMKQDGKSMTYFRSTPDGRQVGGRIHSGGSTPKEGSFVNGSFRDHKTGRTFNSKIIGE